MAGEALDVFISYSHRDEGFKDELVNLHLKPLQREGKINTWQDRDIEAGTEWAGEIKTNLEKADIVLLLITRHFLASDYCYEKEMQRAVQRHYEGTAKVIPIIMEDCGWRYSPFSQLQVLPQDGKPVTRWNDRAEAFFNIEEGVRRVVGSLCAEGRLTEIKSLKQEQEAERIEQELLATEQQRRNQAELLQRDQEVIGAEGQEQERQHQEDQKLSETDLSKQDSDHQNQQEGLEELTIGEISIPLDQELTETVAEPDEQTKQSNDERMQEQQIPIDRRQILQWFIGGLGWLIALVFTFSKFPSQSKFPILDREEPSNMGESSTIDKAEATNRPSTESVNSSSDRKNKSWFGFGLLDMTVLTSVLLLIFGPKKLPQIGYSLGAFIRGFQDASREFEEEFKKEAERIENTTLEDNELGK